MIETICASHITKLTSEISSNELRSETETTRCWRRVQSQRTFSRLSEMTISLFVGNPCDGDRYVFSDGIGEIAKPGYEKNHRLPYADNFLCIGLVSCGTIVRNYDP